jgi:hypothetical protein
LPLTLAPSMTYFAVGQWRYQGWAKQTFALPQIALESVNMMSTTFDLEKDCVPLDWTLQLLGGMAERFKAPVLKTGDP